MWTTEVHEVKSDVCDALGFKVVAVAERTVVAMGAV